MALVQNTDAFPQHASYANSRDDALASLKFFFGDPAQPEKLNLYTDQHALSFYLPDAYEGTSKKIRDTINSLLTDQPDSWYTSEALPLEELTDAYTVEWDEIRFDQRLMQRVPYEGTSRMITASKRKHGASMVRRGLAFMIESDFYRTPQGRQFFNNQIRSIQHCVQQTLNFETIYALLESGNYDFYYDLKRSLLPRRNIIAAMRKEITRFAAVQKEDRGFDKAVVDGLNNMLRYSAKPDMLIIPPEVRLYVTMVPPERTIYNFGGPKAITTFDGGPSAMDTGSVYRDLRIRTCDPFDAGDDTEPMQLLRRRVQVGEFYRMRAPQSMLPEGLPSNYADTWIYDENADRIICISFREAMKFALPTANEADDRNTTGWGPFKGCTGYFHDNDNDTGPRNPYPDAGLRGATASGVTTPPMSQTKDPLGLCDAMTLDAYNMFTNSITADVEERAFRVFAQRDALPYTDQAPGGGGGTAPADAATLKARLLKFFGPKAKRGNGDADRTRCFNYTWTAFQVLAACVEAGIWLPVSITLARPFIEHEMVSMVLMKGGLDTGRNVYGHADMQISSNTAVKVIEGHYTAHFKSIVQNPKNVNVLRDVMSIGYIAGCNTAFFGSIIDDQQMNGKEVITAMEVNSSVSARLNFQREESDNYESMYAFFSPWYEGEQYMQDNAFSVSGGSGLPWDTGSGHTLSNGDVSRLDCNFPGGINNFRRYNDLLYLSAIHTGEDENARKNQLFLQYGTYNNSVVLAGPYRVRNPFQPNSRPELIPGHGHWGQDAMPGDARVRRGESTTFVKARESLMGVEILGGMKLPVTTMG